MPKETRNVIRLNVPLDNNPAVIRGVHLEKQASLHEALRNAMQHLYDTWGAIGDLAEKVQDKTLLAQRAQPVCERAIRAAESAVAHARQRATDLDKAIRGQLVPTRADAAAVEIRTYLRQQKEPLAAANGLVSAGDRRSVAAVLDAPPFLSGLTADGQRAIELRARGAFVPDDQGLLEDLNANVPKLERALASFTERMAANLREWASADHKLIDRELGGSQ
jgi:hypothetical protein